MNPSPSLSTPSKSRKPLLSTPKSKVVTTKTPDKQPCESRLRNRHVALSVKEVRKVAQTRPGSPPHHNQPDRIRKSARRQISSWSNQKSNRAAQAQEVSIKLPEKYEILSEYFDSLDSSMRLLRLKGSMSSFTNISPKIESLTDRRFSYRHLAQMKHILPEAIEIKRVLTFDERTCCMKPDLHVTINVDAIEFDDKIKSQSKHIHLRKIFRNRLADFHNAHPEGDEVPEELLPEPFNRSRQDLGSNITGKSTSSLLSIETLADAKASHVSNKSISSPLSVETLADANASHVSNFSLPMETEALVKQQPVVTSHFSPTFRRHFSQKVPHVDSESIQLKSPKLFLQQLALQAPDPSINNNSFNEEISPVPSPSKILSSTIKEKTCASSTHSSGGVYLPCLPATPNKEIEPTDGRDDSTEKLASIQSTPAKLVSTPIRLMSATPSSNPTKRCYMSPDDDSTSVSNKLVRRPLRTKSLLFDTPLKNVEGDNSKTVDLPVDDEILNILPESLLRSIREKERKAKEEHNPAISQAKRRQQMISCLPKLFNMIHFFFQSVNRSIITKEELVHKIIVSHSDIVDRREAEEQLSLLLEIVPDWISQRSGTSGDLLICINRTSNGESIRARLEQAKFTKQEKSLSLELGVYSIDPEK
ncbi:hypothetical protein K2173_018317 [Erythroxylum novogranatense]|uniref:CDT1 Geminin-binding domain-containing protein n=1 Tax=Erythroxylum novogranatense TaxID=1862640 RepID=A0AAV8UA91_9ROSI|nr:hypothetical protein K2173_018317 [Erythroxylum novogranatense]